MAAVVHFPSAANTSQSWQKQQLPGQFTPESGLVPGNSAQGLLLQESPEYYNPINNYNYTFLLTLARLDSAFYMTDIVREAWAFEKGWEEKAKEIALGPGQAAASKSRERGFQ